jgi:hypothetical protein
MAYTRRVLRMKRRNLDKSHWDNVPIKINYGQLRKIQQRAFNAGYSLAEFTYKDREFKAPDTFEEWFDGESKRIGGYLNDSQELEVLPDEPPPLEYDPAINTEIQRGLS